MLRLKSKILFFTSFVVVLALSACVGGKNLLTGSETGVPYQRQNHLLASTEQPFPHGVEEATSPAGILQVGPDASATSMVATEQEDEAHPVAPTGNAAAALNSFATRIPEVESRLSVNNAALTPGPTHLKGIIPNTGGQTSQGAQVFPVDERSLAFRLSYLTNFNVYDKNGQPLGTAADYIVDMCSDQIGYILLALDPSITPKGVNLVAVPYEALTQGHGVIDVSHHNLVLPITLSQLQGAPVLNQKPDLTNNNWESSAVSFWGKIVQLSASSSQCQSQQAAAQGTPQSTGTPQGSGASQGTGTPTSTITPPSSGAGQSTGTAQSNPQSTSQSGSSSSSGSSQFVYASDLLTMPVQDNNGNQVGQVQDVYQAPETGQLDYIAVDKLSPQQTATAAANESATPAATAQATGSATAQANGAATAQATGAAASQSTPAGPMQASSTSTQAPVQIVVVPASAVKLQQSQNGQALVLTVSPQAFQGAPMFNQLPDFAQPNWDAQILKYWSKYVSVPSQPLTPALANTPTGVPTATGGPSATTPPASTQAATGTPTP